MTFSTANVVTPMLAAPEIIVFLSTGMTTKTSFGDFFLRLVLEGDDFGWVAFFDVSLAWSMTSLTAGYFS